MQKPRELTRSWQRATIQELVFWREEIDAEIAKRDERSGTGSPSQNRQEKKPRPSYRNPDNMFERWNGLGKRPHWITKWLESGGTLDQLKIEPPKD